MPESDLFETEHEITVSAPAARAYDLVANVAAWPHVFPPTVFVEVLENSPSRERMRIWATANGEVKSWVSLREHHPAQLRVDYRQEVSQHPVAAMGGSWIVEPLSETKCRVRLLHDYRSVDDSEETLRWINNALNTNSEAELGALKAAAERETGLDQLMLVFDDTVHIDGTAEDVYDFLYAAQHWEERLPHVARADLREDTPNVQVLDMDTRTREGTLHHTRSVRICLPHHRIVYKQLIVPPIATVHNGQWTVRTAESGGVDVTSEHTVVIKEDGIATVLGQGAGIEDARKFIQEALSHNSLATLNLAKEYVEGKKVTK